MIIRAVSSDEEADERGLVLADTASRDVPGGSFSTVKAAWLVVSAALIALLLLDLAALLNQLVPSTVVEQPRRTDPFSAASLLLHLLRGGSILAPASVLNNLLGQLFVCAWVHTRESALVSKRQRDNERRRGADAAAIITRTLPWSTILGVLCVGHAASCVYILFVMYESHGSGSSSFTTKFWLGRMGSSHTMPRV